MSLSACSRARRSMCSITLQARSPCQRHAAAVGASQPAPDACACTGAAVIGHAETAGVRERQAPRDHARGLRKRETRVFKLDAARLSAGRLGGGGNVQVLA